jgi:hypothetical protein
MGSFGRTDETNKFAIVPVKDNWIFTEYAKYVKPNVFAEYVDEFKFEYLANLTPESKIYYVGW